MKWNTIFNTYIYWNSWCFSLSSRTVHFCSHTPTWASTQHKVFMLHNTQAHKYILAPSHCHSLHTHLTSLHLFIFNFRCLPEATFNKIHPRHVQSGHMLPLTWWRGWTEIAFTSLFPFVLSFPRCSAGGWIGILMSKRWVVSLTLVPQLDIFVLSYARQKDLHIKLWFAAGDAWLPLWLIGEDRCRQHPGAPLTRCCLLLTTVTLC